MTDGTSQGLFIVVAIVIFGIFVVLAYILFEDTLSPSLASMITQATEQASDRLGNSLVSMVDLKGISIGTIDYTWNMNKITFSGESLWHGIAIPSKYFAKEENYSVSFDITLLEGVMSSLGGHLKTSDDFSVFVDGKKMSGWGWDTPTVTNIFEEGKTYHIEVQFYTNRWDDPLHSNGNRSFYIQPNRGNEGIYTRVEVKNILLHRK